MAEKTLRERYRELKDEGFTDEELVKKLKDQGFSSKDYDIPLSQAKERAKLRLEGKLTEEKPAPAPTTGSYESMGQTEEEKKIGRLMDEREKAGLPVAGSASSPLTTSGKPPTTAVSVPTAPTPTERVKGIFEGISDLDAGLGPTAPQSKLSPSAQKLVDDYNARVLPKVKALPEKNRLIEEQRAKAEAELKAKQAEAERVKLDQQLAQAKGKKREQGKVVIPLLQEAVEMFIPAEAYDYLPEAIVPEKGGYATLDKTSTIASPKVVSTKEPPKYAPTLELGPSMERFVQAGKGIAKEFRDEVVDLATSMFNAGSDINYAFNQVSTGGMNTTLPPARFEPERQSKAKQVINQLDQELTKAKKEQAEKGVGTRVLEFPVAVAGGAKDVVVGLADILNYFGGVNVRQGETRSKEAERKGAEVLAGMTGLTANTILNFTNPTLWETKPVEAILGLMPLYDLVLGGALRVPGGLEWSNKFGGYVAKTTQAVKRNKAVSKVRQGFSEGFASTEPGSSAVAEQIFRTPEAEASTLKAAGTRAAEQVKTPTPPREGVDVFGERVIEKEGGQPVVEARQEVLTPKKYVERNYLSPGQEEVIQLSSKEFPVESGGVVGKRKYFTGDLKTTAPTELMEEGGFSFDELDLTQEPARKAKALADQNKPLETKLGTLAGETGGLLQDLTGKPVLGDWLNFVVETYRRTLAENVDNPKAVLREGVEQAIRTQLNTAEVRKYILDNGVKEVNTKINKLVDSVTDLVSTDTELTNNRARIQALLTDSVVIPARTTDLYSIERGTGRLFKGSEVSKSVARNLEERLRNIPKEEQAKYVVGEGEQISPPRQTPELSEFQRQALEQVGAKPVEVVGGRKLGTFGEGLGEALTTQPTRTQNPYFNEAVREVADIVRQVYPAEAEMVITPERVASRFAMAIDNQLTNNIPLLRSPAVKRAIIAGLEEALNQDGTYSKAERNRILRDFDKDVLRDAVVNNNTGKIRGFEIRRSDGGVIFDSTNVRDIVGELNPELVREAKAEAILDLTNDLANETAYYGTRKMIQQEGRRFFSGNQAIDFVRQPEAFAIPMLGRIILKGETPPVFLPFEGTKVAKAISSNIEFYVDELRKAKETELQRPLEQPEIDEIRGAVRDQIDRLNEFVPLDLKQMDEAFGVSPEQLKGVVPETKPFENLYAPPDIASAIKWELQSRAALRNPSFGLGIFQAAKRNLTARALTALKNNNISNTLALAVKNGDPFVALSVFKDGFMDFYFGDRTQMSPTKRRAYEAIERSGIIDTTELARDIGKASDFKPLDSAIRFLLGEEGLRNKQGTGLYRTIETANQKYSSAMKVLESAYSKAGDIPFKVYEAVRAYERLENSAMKVKDGNYVGGMISKNVEVRLTKSGTNYTAEFFDTSGKKVPNLPEVNGTLESPKISQILGRISAYEANKVVLDYGDVGVYNKVLRSFPILNAMSGFYTYYWKTMDIPGFKRGMAANMFLPEEMVKTNDKAVRIENLNKATLAATRRALIANMALGQVYQHEGKTPEEKRAFELVKKSIAINPSQAGSILLGPVGDLSQQYYNDFGSSVPFKSTDVLMKVGVGALMRAAGYFSPKDVERELFPLYKLNAERLKPAEKARVEGERKRLGFFLKDLRGESFSANDVLELVGQGGNAVFDMLDEIADTEEQGKVFSLPKAANTFMGSLIGRTPYSLISNAFTLAGSAIPPPTDPTKETFMERVGETARDFSPYGKEMRKMGFVSGNVSPDLQKLSLYMIAQVIGSGWRKVNVLDESENPVSGGVIKSRYEQYLTGVEKELNASLVKPLEERAKQYYGLSQQETDPVRKAKYQETYKFYQKNTEMVKDQIQMLLDQDRKIVWKTLNPLK